MKILKLEIKAMQHYFTQTITTGGMAFQAIMLQEGYITQEEYNTAVEEPLVLALYRDPIFKEDYMTSYALDCATEELMLQNGNWMLI